MTWVYVVLGLSVVTFILVLAQIELHRNLESLRQEAGFYDHPEVFNVTALQVSSPSFYGLPVALDKADNHIVLFLSDGCSTCRSIASAISGSRIPAVTLVLESKGDVASLSSAYDLTGFDYLIDVDHSIAGRLGIVASPLALMLKDGRIDSAQSVPSVRQFLALLANATTNRVLLPQAATRGRPFEVSLKKGAGMQ